MKNCWWWLGREEHIHCTMWGYQAFWGCNGKKMCELKRWRNGEYIENDDEADTFEIKNNFQSWTYREENLCHSKSCCLYICWVSSCILSRKKKEMGLFTFCTWRSLPAVTNASTFRSPFPYACKLELYKVMFLEIESNHDECNDGGRRKTRHRKLQVISVALRLYSYDSIERAEYAAMACDVMYTLSATRKLC